MRNLPWIIAGSVVATAFVLFLWMKCAGLPLISVGAVEVKPFDIASLLLAAATLVVTGVGVAVAILTFWGYGEIKKASVKAAVKKAEKAAREQAEVVVARYLRDLPRPETTAQQAEEIVSELKAEDAKDGN